MPLSELKPEQMPPGRVVETEGAYAGRVDNTLALRGSSTIFVVTPEAAGGFRFGDLGTESWVHITGVVAFQSESLTYYVRVTGLRMAPSARERVLAVMTAPASTADDLFAIGDWAKGQGSSFGDERLQTLAEAAYTKALKMRDLAVKPGDYEGYFALADTAEKYLGRASLREYYVREGIDAMVENLGSRTRSPGTRPRVAPKRFCRAARSRRRSSSRASISSGPAPPAGKTSTSTRWRPGPGRSSATGP